MTQEVKNLCKIPSRTQVGGQRIDIINEQEIKDENDNLLAGHLCLYNGTIKIAKKIAGIKQSDASRFNTYNHELVHAILFTMGEYKLSQNEKFVNTFAGFLTESMVCSEY